MQFIMQHHQRTCGRCLHCSVCFQGWLQRRSNTKQVFTRAPLVSIVLTDEFLRARRDQHQFRRTRATALRRQRQHRFALHLMGLTHSLPHPPGTQSLRGRGGRRTNTKGERSEVGPERCVGDLTANYEPFNAQRPAGCTACCAAGCAATRTSHGHVHVPRSRATVTRTMHTT